MEISKSDIIISIAGRDEGKLFYVLDVDGEYVLIANGRERKLENPKRKKLKHVRRVSRTETRVAQKLLSGDKVLNSELRRDLAKFSQDFMCQNQGGN
ncbi:MAG: KOW domain-containing RNA-binding protein [Clostridia bacterium]|nr:KOW domain-containing RNA-binding protein [Clostridia bacterium]